MRFFKSFPAFTFHRRSKSDSSIPKPTLARDYIPNRPLSLDAAQAALFAAAIPACPKTFLFPTPADASNAIFELETANARLQNDVSAFAHGCAQLRSELEAARADIFAQLHLNSLLQRQVHADRSEMDALQVKLAQYERFLGLMISVGLHQRVLGDAHIAMRAGIDPDQALVSAIKQAAAVPGSAWSTILPSITGPRTPDEYRSSLHLTLKTRKELRDAKKIAKFWKRIGEEARPGLVTPSVSTISSIHEPLPAERQKAVEELMASRRRSSLASQADTSEVAAITIPASASSLSASTSSASASTSPTLPDITPSHSSSSDSPCLSPLASESFKTELASRSSTRLFKRGPAASVSKQTRPPLGQIDTNIARNAGQQSLKATGKRKASSRDENTPPQLPKVSIPPRGRDLSVANVVPSFSKHSLCSNHLGPLGRIEEEREDFVLVDLDDVDVSRDSEGNASGDLDSSQDSNWSMLDFPDQDLSLSFCDAAVSTPQTTPERSGEEVEVEASTPSKTLRLPKPMLKQLNRMSMTKKVVVPRAPTPLAVRKKSAGPPATTRLPTSMRGTRNVWRT